MTKLDSRVKDCKYSVLMSVYHKDNPEYLKLAIESMLNQTVKPEQYVIVKDGPLTEELDKVILAFEKEYPTLFTILCLPDNKGLAVALNEGLKTCRNELIARMDADDISLPERCEKELMEFVEDSRIDICGCNIDEFYDDISDIRTSRVVPSTHEEIMRFMKKRQPFNHPTVIYKRDKVLNSGGYIPLKRKEDFDLFSRMIQMGCYTKNIQESLYLYRANIENYRRRKSFINLRSAIYVYLRHLRRGGCNIIDFVIISGAEMLFFIMPFVLMRKVSDKLLRG